MNQTRLDTLRHLLDWPEDKVDALLITDMINVGYLSGFSGSTAMLLISHDEDSLLTDFRYVAQAKNECPGWQIVDISDASALSTAFLDRPKLKRVGYESTDVTVARLNGWKKHAEQIEWIPVGSSISRIRLIKDEGEIMLIRRAIEIAQDSFFLTTPLLTAGTSEREFALELEFAMRRGGADSVSFDTIVASGPNGAFPHHRPSDRTFEEGDLVTIDWGAKFRGYCSDITRTVLIGGSLDSKQQNIYNIVEEAKTLAISAITPGKNGKEIDSIARDYISSHGYGEYFGHSLGHSLGRDVHDGNMLSQRAEEVILEPGMVTTVEPGIYIEGFGGVRIEEDVLVTESGAEILTTQWSGLPS